MFGAIATGDLRVRHPAASTSHRPCSLVPSKRGEAGARVEARPAQPVDRAAARDERHRLTIADDRVVLEWRAHTSPIVTELLRDCHRAFELSDVDLLHAQHRFHRTLCRVGLVILQQVIE